MQSNWKVVQLEKTEVNAVGELNRVDIQLASDPRIQQYIDIQVVDIPDAYGMLLSHYWSRTLNGYMSTYFSHMWLPWRGLANQIIREREPRLKELITEYNRVNEILFIEPELGIDTIEVGKEVKNEVPMVSPPSQTEPTSDESLFWTLKFDGSKSEGVGLE